MVALQTFQRTVLPVHPGVGGGRLARGTTLKLDGLCFLSLEVLWRAVNDRWDVHLHLDVDLLDGAQLQDPGTATVCALILLCHLLNIDAILLDDVVVIWGRWREGGRWISVCLGLILSIFFNLLLFTWQHLPDCIGLVLFPYWAVSGP